MDQKLQASFMDLFEGLKRAHGTYEITETRSDNKQTGKAATLVKPVTEELWLRHFEGKRRLGIVPINDDSLVKFGAIDIDKYDNLSHAGLFKLLESKHLPLVVCRSKSGGAHLYLFMNEWVPAGLVQSKLRELAAALGYGGCEIFPKQTELLASRGDVGQWINMPYFDAYNTQCYAVGNNGIKFLPEDFIKYATDKRISLKQLESLDVELAGGMEDGPPCLQHLITQGFPQGTRNDGLFNIGVYYKKSDPDGWEKKVEEANNKWMEPPLSAEEIMGTKKSLRKKDFNYTCSKPPIVSHCNSAVCRLRKFGIGGSNNIPVMTSITKFDSNPPIWFVDVEGSGRLELTTEELHQQPKFQKRCIDTLNMFPSRVSNATWEQMVNHLLSTVSIVEAPDDASPEGQLMEHIRSFCNGKARARTKEEIILGKPWLDEDSGLIYFRLQDLLSYLERHHFREFKSHKITSILKNRGFKHDFKIIKGHGTNLWGTLADAESKPLEVPDEVKNDKQNY